VLLFGVVVILVTYGVLAIASLRYEWQSRASRSGAAKNTWAFLPGFVMLVFCVMCLYSQVHPAPPPIQPGTVRGNRLARDRGVGRNLVETESGQWCTHCR
jgi:uncharacterized BrkB/YihY/UPF0761 family membrane protein